MSRAFGVYMEDKERANVIKNKAVAMVKEGMKLVAEDAGLDPDCVLEIRLHHSK